MRNTTKKYSTVFIVCFFMALIKISTAQEIYLIKGSQDPSGSMVTLGKHKSGETISKDEMLAIGKLSVSAPHDSSFHIVKFRLLRTRKGEESVELRNDISGEFTEAMKELISSSLKGDTIYFEYIKCKGPDSTTRSVSALEFPLE